MDPTKHEGRPSSAVAVKKSKKKGATDHVVFNFNTGYLECYRCGTWYDYNGRVLPAPIDFAVKVSEAFRSCHRRCYKSERGAALKAAAIELGEKVTAYFLAEGARLGVKSEDREEIRGTKGFNERGLTDAINNFKHSNEAYLYGR